MWDVLPTVWRYHMPPFPETKCVEGWVYTCICIGTQTYICKHMRIHTHTHIYTFVFKKWTNSSSGRIGAERIVKIKKWLRNGQRMYSILKTEIILEHCPHPHTENTQGLNCHRHLNQHEGIISVIVQTICLTDVRSYERVWEIKFNNAIRLQRLNKMHSTTVRRTI
jgi:hypothetical protein